MTIFSVTPKEWLEAELFFKENPDEIKYFRKRKKRKENEFHSFIRIGNQIMALSNAHITGYLGEGGSAKVKLAMTQKGEIICVRIKGISVEGELYDKEVEKRLLEATGMYVAQVERQLTTIRTYKDNQIDKKRYTFQIPLNKNLFQEIVQSSEFGKRFFPNPKSLEDDLPEKTWEKIVEASGLDETQRALLGLKSCLAIQRVHDLGFVHADVKLDNFMTDFSEPPSVYGIDYEISKDLQGKEYIETECEGTDGYMAPEIDNQPLARFSFASDVYALGVVMKKLGIPKEVFDFEKMQAENPKDRPDLSQVIKQACQVLERKSNVHPEDRKLIETAAKEMQQKIKSSETKSRSRRLS